MLLLLLLASLGSIVASAADCSRVSTGLQPLNAPFFNGGRAVSGGGLYPQGNARPAKHEAAGQALVPLVRPRAADGTPDAAAGRIVLLSIGMSNTTAEFQAFQALAAGDPDKNPRVMLVDGAIGSWSADKIVADPSGYFTGVNDRLLAAGVTAAQVQAVWLKEADANPRKAFPDDAKQLQTELAAIVGMLRSRFPNLKLVYLSSRIYGGYATTSLNPEPFAYDSGFAVKWLIEQQMNGEIEASPWLAWGPYLWADGAVSNFDGLSWSCSDFADDGTHPSGSGRARVARMLLEFFKSDTTARPWFVAKASPGNPSPAAMVNAAGYFAPMGGGSVASLFGTDLAPSLVAAQSFPLPYGLSGTSVEVGGEPAPLYAVSPTQINLLIPANARDSSVVVIREGKRSAPITTQLSLVAPEGLFANALHANGTLVTSQSPARRDEIISLWGTGKGIRNPLLKIADFLPEVRFNSQPAELLFFGPAPGIPGLDQFNVRVPSTAASGLADVAVVVLLGGAEGNHIRIPVE